MNGEGSLLDLAAVMGVMNNARNNNRDYGDDGFGFGGYGIWFLMIIFLMAMFGGGFGGFGGGWGNGAFGGAMNQLTNEFLYTNLNNSIQRGIDQSTQQNFGLQKDLCQGFAGVQAALAENRFSAEKCCCETKQQIMENRYLAQKDTCEIIQNVQSAKQEILNQMTNDKIDELRASLNTATVGNLIQQAVQSVVAQVAPRAVPSFNVCPPNTNQTSNLLETLLLANLSNGGLFNNGNCGNCNGYNYNFC